MPKRITKTKTIKKTQAPVKRLTTRSLKPATTRAKVGSAVKTATKSTVTPEVAGPQASVVGPDGKVVGKITLPAKLFAAKVNKTLLGQAVRVYLANQRMGTASTKTRGEVEGSTRKIYRQKGTGRARHGSIRAPIFVGGGIVFGPRPRDYSLSLSKKMKLAALSAALTVCYQAGKVIVVDGLGKLEAKTKVMAKALSAISAARSTLLVVGSDADLVKRCTRNIAGVDIELVSNLNPYTILAHQRVVFVKEAIPLLKERFGRRL